VARLQLQPGGPPLLVVATGPYAGEGFDCPALDTLFLAAPVANKGSLTQYVGRILSAIEHAKPGSTELRTLAAYVEALGGRLEIIADFGDQRLAFIEPGTEAA
jgi:hypothetical protein